MWQYIFKVGITALVVVAVAELARRQTFWAAALASLPLTSILAFIWLQLETGDSGRVAALSASIFWLALPSLVLFLLLPLLLRCGWNFWLSLAGASLGTALAYGAMLALLGRLGIRL